MRSMFYFLLFLAICITAAYTYNSWLPPVIDFVFQKSTPADNFVEFSTTSPDYLLYQKYKSAETFSEPFEQCYVQCAKGDLSGFQFCSTANRCASLQ